LPKGYYLQIANRSGVATKMGLLKGAEVCDFLYDGEIIVNLHNYSNVPVPVQSGMKVAQCLLLPLPDWSFEEAPEDYTLNSGTLRADKGFGSSGI
jgi:dUTPase